MNLWARQYDLLQLKYLRILRDLGEVEAILSQPVVQADASTKLRTERLIIALRSKTENYRVEMAHAKRMRDRKRREVNE